VNVLQSIISYFALKKILLRQEIRLVMPAKHLELLRSSECNSNYELIFAEEFLEDSYRIGIEFEFFALNSKIIKVLHKPNMMVYLLLFTIGSKYYVAKLLSVPSSLQN